MIYDLFWLDLLIASLLWVAAGTAISGHFPRKWMRAAFDGFVFLFPLVILLPPAAMAGGLCIARQITHRWLIDPLFVLVIFFAGEMWICYRGRQKKGAPFPRSSNWPRMPLIFAVFVTGALACVMLMNIEVVLRAQLVLVDQRLLLAYQRAEPALASASQNAAPLYQTVQVRLGIDPGKQVTNPPLGEAETFNAREPATIAFLARQSSTISLIRRAADLPVCRYPIDSDTPDAAMMNKLLDELNFEREPADVLSLDAREQAAHGNVAAAMADVEAILKMGRQFAQRPMILSALVGIGIDGLGYKTLEEILPAVKRQSDLANLDFEQLAPVPQLFQNALRSEERYGLRSLTSLPWMNAGWEKGGGIELMPAYVWPAGMEFREMFLDIDGYLAVMDFFQDAAIQPYYTVKAQLSKIDHSHLGLLAEILLPSLDRSLEGNARAVADDACARTAVAMTRYRLDHGSLPTRLSALVPDYLDAIPTDPFDGHSLRLVIRNDNWIIYSVGPNGIDDGGVGYDKTHKAKDDVTFKLKATPASAKTKQ